MTIAPRRDRGRKQPFHLEIAAVKMFIVNKVGKNQKCSGRSHTGLLGGFFISFREAGFPSLFERDRLGASGGDDMA